VNRMNAPVLPPGAERLRRLRVLILDVDEAVEELCEALPQINDPDLRPRIVAFAEGARATLDAEREAPGPDVANRLNELLNGVRELRIPARDPDLGGTPTLKALEQATGVIAIRLINALEAAEAMGWKPRQPDLPERMTAIVARDEAGTLLDRIADRLDRVNASLDQLVTASANAPRHQQGLVNFYVGSIRVELNLARMELKIGETRVDFAALWRAVEATADLTGDFITTLRAWAARVPESLMRAAGVVRQRIGKMVTGVGATLRFVARNRRRADAGEISGTDPADEPVPEDVEERARDMILEGRAPPAAWRPFIRRLRLMGSNLDRFDLLVPLSELQWLDASSTQIADLSPLTGLRGLQELWLMYTQVADLSPLAGLRGLEALALGGTQVADLSPLAGLHALEWLDLGSPQVVDLGPLAGLRALQTLYIAHTQVSDLAPLAGMSGLRRLYLAEGQEVDLTPLAGLKDLEIIRQPRPEPAESGRETGGASR